jgi:hypothetical protein
MRCTRVRVQITYFDVNWVSRGDNPGFGISEKGYDHRLVRLVQGYSGPHAPPVVLEDITEVPAGGA